MAKWTLGCVVLCGLLIAGVSVHAHHSLAGVYALGKEAKVTGTFKAFRLVNPHSSMKLEAKGPDDVDHEVGSGMLDDAVLGGRRGSGCRGGRCRRLLRLAGGGIGDHRGRAGGRALQEVTSVRARHRASSKS